MSIPPPLITRACVCALGTLSGQASPSRVRVFIARPLTRKQSPENKTMTIFKKVVAKKAGAWRSWGVEVGGV